MNNFRFFIYLSLAVLVLSACKSTDVASESWLQKRKFRKGFHLENPFKSKVALVPKQKRIIHFASALEKEEEALRAFKDENTFQLKIGGNDDLDPKNQFEPSDTRTLEPLNTIASIPPDSAEASIGDDYFGEEESLDMVKRDRYALTSFISAIGSVVSIVGSVVFPFFGLLFIVLSILALTFGIMGLKSENRLWMALIGVIIGGLFSLFIFLGLLFALILIAVLI